MVFFSYHRNEKIKWVQYLVIFNTTTVTTFLIKYDNKYWINLIFHVGKMKKRPLEFQNLGLFLNFGMQPFFCIKQNLPILCLFISFRYLSSCPLRIHIFSRSSRPLPFTLINKPSFFDSRSSL